jgi:hypothetical protein
MGEQYRWVLVRTQGNSGVGMPAEQQRVRLQGRLSKLEREIEVAALKSSIAEHLAEEASDRSDLGWLMTIGASTAGTLLAVTQGREAAAWSTKAHAFQLKVMVLRAERQSILDDLTLLDP